MAQRMAQQQMSIEELRQQLSQRLRSNAAFSQTVYHEQPIIMTGAQLKNAVPDPIRQARHIARSMGTKGNLVTVFYEQARLLAGYEDDFEYSGDFIKYYPTYEDMSTEQLRGYFTWRSKVRAGNIVKAPLSFAYLYMYELMHLIGVEGALQAHAAMLAFSNSFRTFDKRFGRYADIWADDLVIYYGLDASLLHNVSFTANDAAFAVLEHWNTCNAQDLFNALCQLSAYPLTDSPFYLEHGQELQDLIIHAYRTAAQHHGAKLKTSLAAKLSGRMNIERYWPFQRAVFANPLKVESASYSISPYDTITCTNGVWFRSRYTALEGPLPWVTHLLETCESILRDAYAYPNMLGRPLTTKYLIKEAEAHARALAAAQQERKARAVHIDFSKLEHIRATADITCEKLIVDEEDKQVQSADVLCRPTNRAEENASAPTPLTSEEHALLKHLLAGGNIHSFEQEHACMASVLIDSINEKLFEMFSDICIDTCGDKPTLIEDYIEELKCL